MSGPNFKKTLEPVTVTEGQEAKFEIEFEGDPMPVVKWYRYSFPIVDSDDFKITTEGGRSTLTVLNACPDDTGIFSVVLENIGGASKSSTNLNVVEAGQEYVLQASTRTTRRLQEMTVSAGDNIRFDIQFTAGDKSQLEFFHDGRPLKEEEEGVKILFDNDLATLLIEHAAPKHSGLYECLMKTLGGEARCQVKCQVVENKIEGKMEMSKMEKRMERMEKMEQKTEHKMEQKVEQKTEHKMEQRTEHKMEHKTEHKSEMRESRSTEEKKMSMIQTSKEE
jgi:hypothetical protein